MQNAVKKYKHVHVHGTVHVPNELSVTAHALPLYVNTKYVRVVTAG